MLCSKFCSFVELFVFEEEKKISIFSRFWNPGGGIFSVTHKNNWQIYEQKTILWLPYDESNNNIEKPTDPNVQQSIGVQKL